MGDSGFAMRLDSEKCLCLQHYFAQTTGELLTVFEATRGYQSGIGLASFVPVHSGNFPVDMFLAGPTMRSSGPVGPKPYQFVYFLRDADVEKMFWQHSVMRVYLTIQVQGWEWSGPIEGGGRFYLPLEDFTPESNLGLMPTFHAPGGGRLSFEMECWLARYRIPRSRVNSSRVLEERVSLLRSDVHNMALELR